MKSCDEKNLIFERMFSGKLESSGTIRRKLTWDNDDNDDDDGDNGDDDDDDDDNDNPDLVLDLLHAGGLHDLLENGSLDRPQLSVSHRLQVSSVSLVLTNLIILTILTILIRSTLAIVIMIMVTTLTLMLAVRLQL